MLKRMMLIGMTQFSQTRRKRRNSETDLGTAVLEDTEVNLVSGRTA
jgi:hypothetical protein